MRRALPPLLPVALLLVASGCVDPVTLAEPPDTSPLTVGESREVELRYLRLDVRDFTKTLTLDELSTLPRATLQRTWLFDLEARPLVENVLRQIATMPPEEMYSQPMPAQNLARLLAMTPENADLSGTPLAGLLGVGKAVGLSPSMILADLGRSMPNELIAPPELAAIAVLENIMATHPNTKLRPGPVTPDHPEGLYPVTPGSIPVSLYDVATRFAGLAERFGPAPLDRNRPGGGTHPGFIRAASGLEEARETFLMTVKVTANALPYKGIDASHASVASVNAVPGQIERIFDFSDPEWMKIEGLPPEMKIDEMTMSIVENDAYLPGGTSRDPLPAGNSPVWSAAPWDLERVLAETGRRITAGIAPHCTVYSPAGNVPEPLRAVEVCIDSTGWVEIRVDPSVILDEPPLRPSYFWDMLLEVAQARMHDGGLAEGGADVAIQVRDVAVGTKTDVLLQRIRENFEKDPALLLGMVEVLTASTVGDADFYYVQPEGGREDWLFFVAPEDLRKNEEGEPVRSYGYARPGFFADPGLTQKVSTRESVDGDTAHEKVRIGPGTRLHIEDAEGQRYAIKVGEKPSPHRVSLTVTRLD
ncbi:acetyltransferase [Polyangium aurulentum]|uniref:acetyltransferase n=1 Tax=Polyangium aurulentum TaxID=2567896 RepID=UPI001F391AEC|nr:acetyltransferase [Polyangium aurulentum]